MRKRKTLNNAFTHAKLIRYPRPLLAVIEEVRARTGQTFTSFVLEAIREKLEREGVIESEAA